MATKKLKVELELETSKAKRQARELEQTAGGGGTVSAPQSGKKLSESLDKAARSAEKSSSAFDRMSGQSARLTRGFAGIAVGMATSYAANYATGGTKTALEYGGNAISGAVGGAMMAGPVGAIVGGLAGVLKTYMDKQGDVSKMSEDFKVAEDTYENNRLWQAKMRNMSEVDFSPVGLKGVNLTQDRIDKTSARLEEVQKVAVDLFDEQNKIIKRINEHLKKGETEEAEKLQKDLAIVRAKKEQAESLEQSYKKQKKSLEHQLEQERHDAKDPRVSTAALDSLGKVGGDFIGSLASGGPAASPAAAKASPPSGGIGFGFSVPKIKYKTYDFTTPYEDHTLKIVNDRIEKIDSDQLQVLKDIKSALESRQNGGSEWL